MEAPSSLLDGMLLILSLIGIAAVSSLVLKKLNFPYTIGLVVVGIFVGILTIIYPSELAMFANLQLSSDIIMFLILPVIIFEAALNIDSRVLFKNIVPILILVVFGVLISAFIVGGVLSFTLGVSFGAMLLFGALISATDPVAVLGLFKDMGAPRRLTTIIDGESMANDATAIVLFGIVLTLTYTTGAMTASACAAGINISTAILEFAKVFLGGTAIGAAVGFFGSHICKLDKGGREYQIVMSIIMAYSAFIISDLLHFSGVMGSLAAGIVLSLKAESVIKRRNREQVESFWGFFSFLANSFVFLLMGITQAQIFYQSPITSEIVLAMFAAAVALLVARYISVISCNLPYNFFARKKNPELVIPHKYSLILTWGGLRGVIPAALALAIPADYPMRNLILKLTIFCILFSLFVQGTTIKKLIYALGIKPEESELDESVCIKKNYHFSNPGIIDLIMSKIIRHCEEEGFFVREKKFGEHTDYLMKMQNNIFLFRTENENIEIIASNNDIAYASTIMYETVVELNRLLGSIAELAKPDKMQQMIAADNDSAQNASFHLMKYLSRDTMIVPLRSKDRNGVIGELVDILERAGKISSFREGYNAVIEREESMSTGLGDGVAFPHAKTDMVENISVAIGICPSGVDFKAIDRKPVHIVAAILSPKKDSAPHLQFLSEMSKLLSKANMRENIINAKTPDELYEIFKNSC